MGLEKYSPSVKAYYYKSNARSGIYLGSVISFLELLMLINMIHSQIEEHNFHHVNKLLFFCHISLLITGIAMLINSICFLRKKQTSRKIGFFINIIFAFVAILFGLYSSYRQYLQGSQFIPLFTMSVFTFCFLAWRPVFSITILTSSVLFFYCICNSQIPATYSTKINLLIIWIAVLMSALNIFHQKIKEAKKEEKLEENNRALVEASNWDETCEMPNMKYFINRTKELLKSPEIDVSKMLFLFVDIENFKGYNEKHGFFAGNDYLRHIGHFIEKTFEGSTTAHFSNDNFVVFTKDEGLSEKLEKIQEELKRCDNGIFMKFKTGSYRPKDRDCLPTVACDRARYACYSIKRHFDKNYCEYTDKMNDLFLRKQYIINNIDKALENEYVQVYYQPLVDAQSEKICGFEALARWNDPEYGFLMPATFIETLEEYYLINKLDMYMLNKVCNDLLVRKELGKNLVPVSINFSRLDFEIPNFAAEVDECLKKFNIEKNLIHIEITESALNENDGKLQKSMKLFRGSGYALWLDDFGSGYSGLNVLKEYDFDVMKIDMKFLQNFSGNKKTKLIIKNIVSLASDIGMSTLIEGVETDDELAFLKEIGCHTLQGYLFGKPMPKEELDKKITSGLYSFA